jgi:hypothetical protein
MSKYLEDVTREPARIKAARRWRNHDLEKRVKEDIKAKRLAPPPIKAEPDVGDIIENDKMIRGEIVRAQTKFANEIRDMLKQHTLRNILLYKLSLRYQKRRLLFEKLKRLEAKAAEQNQGGSNA